MTSVPRAWRTSCTAQDSVESDGLPGEPPVNAAPPTSTPICLTQRDAVSCNKTIVAQGEESVKMVTGLFALPGARMVREGEGQEVRELALKTLPVLDNRAGRC